MTHDTVLTNPQVGKVFAFQSVAMNIGTLAWPVFYILFVFMVFINIIITTFKALLINFV